MERLTLRTSDGHELAADVTAPAGADATDAVVVCHPHPQYGGDRTNHVVTALFDAADAAGMAALRFDFRRGGDPVTARVDVVTALDALAATAPSARLHLAGYSYGAAVALGVDDDRVVSIVAVAPPLPMMPVDPPSRPTLVLVPEHDQFAPPDVAGPIVDTWPDASWRAVPMGDHFLAGRAGVVADQAISWLVASRPPTSRST